MVEQWNFYAGHPFQPADSDVLTCYEKIGGYVPGDPSTDNGATMLDMLRYWRNTGLGGHKIVAYMALDITNVNQVKQAILYFGGVYLGLGLPLSAMDKDDWTVPNGGVYGPQGVPYGWGGHDVPVMAASPHTLTCVTWGKTLKMSWNFFWDYAGAAAGGEAYVILSHDWFSVGGLAPSGFNISQLQADLANL
jgi:hypothetical protein